MSHVTRQRVKVHLIHLIPCHKRNYHLIRPINITLSCFCSKEFMWQDIRTNLLPTARQKVFKRILFVLIYPVFQKAKSKGQKTSKPMAFQSSGFSVSLSPSQADHFQHFYVAVFHASVANPCILMRLIPQETHHHVCRSISERHVDATFHYIFQTNTTKSLYTYASTPFLLFVLRGDSVQSLSTFT